MKVCSDCFQTLHESSFYKHPQGKNGLNSCCKECSWKRTKQSRDSNRENYLAKKRDWTNKNYLLRAKNFSKDAKSFLRTLLQGKPERKGLTINDLEDLLENQEGKCALTGVELTFVRGEGRIRTNASIDRISPGGPYIKENVRLVCRIANTIKLNMEDEELFWWCNKILEYKGL
jgi:hypothetical protein